MSLTKARQGLPSEVWNLVEERTGPIASVDAVAAGRNHDLGMILHTQNGAIFLKGVRNSDRRARRQVFEAAMASVAAAVSPRLLWHLPDVDGWNLLAFEAITDARHADLSPGSPDIETIADALSVLGNITARPGTIGDRIERRWAEHGTPDDLLALRGDHLLHTDLRPDNVLIKAGRAWIVDWSWPTLGAPWIDTACVALWLIAFGHPPASAESWLRRVLAAGQPHRDALDAFVAVSARLWSSIAKQDLQRWKVDLAQAGTTWAKHRRVRND